MSSLPESGRPKGIQFFSRFLGISAELCLHYFHDEAPASRNLAMETTFTIIKQNAPHAVMLLPAVLYLNEDLAQLRSDMADLGERMARVETKIDGIDGRLYRVEGLLDEMRPLEINVPKAQGAGARGVPIEAGALRQSGNSVDKSPFNTSITTKFNCHPLPLAHAALALFVNRWEKIL